MNEEKDIRIEILNSLQTTPHREIELIIGLHKEMISRDPVFYGHLAVWYSAHGEIRDHEEAFVATLLTSELEEHRDAGFVMLKNLEPYRVERVRNHVKKLFKKDPRAMKTAIKQYLREREASPQWFDKCVLRARRAMKAMYAGCHIKPSKRADNILFKDKPPQDSLSFYLKVLADATGSEEQARLIAEHKIPYTVAVGAISEMSAPIMIALIDAMSPQELINNLGSIKKSGSLRMPGVQDLVDIKLEKATSNKRVSANKATIAAEAAGVSQETKKKLDKVANKQIRAKGTIKRSTALLVDKSGSLTVAIDKGRDIAAAISGVMADDADLYVWAFDSMAREIVSEGTEMTDWQKAFKHVRASGGTSVGAGIAALRMKKQRVEQIIIVTDEGEYHSPSCDRAYLDYVRAMGTSPDITIVRVGRACDAVQKKLRNVGASVDTIDFNGDYYSISNLIPMLTKGSQFELLMDIMEYKLPVRTDKPVSA